MVRVFVLLLVLLGAGLPVRGEPLLPTGAPLARIAEPVRLCGTNSSRSRRCNFGLTECIASGKSEQDCKRALAVCRSCIDVMVDCMRLTSHSCALCAERYDHCMKPWVDIMSRPRAQAPAPVLPESMPTAEADALPKRPEPPR